MIHKETLPPDQMVYTIIWLNRMCSKSYAREIQPALKLGTHLDLEDRCEEDEKTLVEDD